MRLFVAEHVCSGLGKWVKYLSDNLGRAARGGNEDVSFQDISKFCKENAPRTLNSQPIVTFIF